MHTHVLGGDLVACDRTISCSSEFKALRQRLPMLRIEINKP